MKLFKSSSNDIINDLRNVFNFSMPSKLLAIRTRLEGKFISCYGLLNHYGIIKTSVISTLFTELTFMLFHFVNVTLLCCL